MLKGYYANVKDIDHGEDFVFGLDTFELDILRTDEHMFVVIDHESNQMYRTEAETYENAITKYIDWVYGEVDLWKYDAEEDGYVEADEKVMASTRYTYQLNHTHFNFTEGD